MSILGLPRTVGNIRRATQIAMVLTQHGFGHLLGRLRMTESVPGLSRLRLTVEKSASLTAERPMPVRLAQVLEELGPTFVKFGQLLATRPDLLPAPYLEAFARLQDRVEPFPGEEAKATIEASLERPVAEVFAEFDATPLASGSIGQVHGAVLRDGTPVVVKVKRPHTDARIREDLDLLLWFADQTERSMPELEPLRPRALCEEFARTMRREIDFVAEASYTAKFGQEFADSPAAVIPTVYWDFVTHDVLTVERLRGKRLSDPDTLTGLARPDRERLAHGLGTVFVHQFFVTGMFHADPHPGNVFLLSAGRFGLIDFGQSGHLSGELRQQLAMVLVALSHSDFDTIADIFAEVGAAGEKTSLREFKTDLIHLIDRYYGVPVEKIDFAHAFEELVTVAREHNMYLPRDLVLLGKSLVTVVGLAQRIDPKFRLDQVAKPFTKQLLREQVEPGRVIRHSAFSLYRLVTLLRRAPGDIKEILQMARTGRLRVIFHHEALEGLTERIDRSFSRLSLALVLGAIIIGSATVLSSPSMASQRLPMLGDLPISYLFAGLGFMAAVLIGFALVWSIIRSDRM